MIKKLLIFLVVAGLGGAAVAYYLWNKPHQNMQSAKADMQVDAKTLFSDYETNEEAANAKYLGKILEVSGVVRESTSKDSVNTVVLETEGMMGVSCTLDPLSTHPRTSFPAGETITLKGTCNGFVMDVQMDRCVEVKPEK